MCILAYECISSAWSVCYLLPTLLIFIASYRENPSLGDPNSLIEELLEMRNKIRIKETDLIMVRGKVIPQII